MNLHTTLSALFTRQLTRTAAGRTHLLNQMADAEGGDGGELMIFDRLLAFVDDDKLQKMIRLHKEDEERHEQLFRDCAKRHGELSEKVPDELKLLLRLDKVVNLFNRPVTSEADVLRAYLALLVIEERAMTQFGIFRDAFERAGDYETARVLAEVEADEARHLKYCHAITKRFAPDEETRVRELEKIRLLEARAFVENGRANMAYVLAHGYIQGAGWKLFWRTLQKLSAGREHKAPTAFSQLAARA